MPLNNRYVVAAFDKDGERLAFLSPEFNWVERARAATIFQSQVDANHFIEQNDLINQPRLKTPELDKFDHVQALFVTVNQQIAKESENSEEGISFTGIYG